MEYTVGAVVEGKVTGITKFGAFVSLPGNKTGMVHISEIAHAYVNDINEFLTVGQEVKAMIIAMDDGKINLSIKRTTEAPARQARNDRQGGYQQRGDRGDRQGQNRSYQQRNDRGEQRSDRQNGERQGSDRQGGERQNGNRSFGDRQQRSDGGNRGRGFQKNSGSKEPQTFDDMLKQFMADSDSNISSNKMYADHRTKRRRQ